MPAGIRITPGNPHDSGMYIPLIRNAKRNLELDDAIAVFADGAYDDPELRTETRKTFGCDLYAAINPRRSKPLKAIKDRIKDVFERWGDKRLSRNQSGRGSIGVNPSRFLLLIPTPNSKNGVDYQPPRGLA